jgi:hypothetical protein
VLLKPEVAAESITPQINDLFHPRRIRRIQEMSRNRKASQDRVLHFLAETHVLLAGVDRLLRHGHILDREWNFAHGFLPESSN